MSDNLTQVSEELADTVASAGRSVVRVEGRRRIAASGIAWSQDGLIVTADHVVEDDENIKIGLAAAGSDATKILRMVTYLTRREDIDVYRSARIRHLPTDLPASTLLFISGLASPDYLMEVDVTAALD